MNIYKYKKNISRKVSGVIALTTLLIITSLLTIGGVTLLLAGLDLARISESSSNSLLAEAKGQSCLEESLIQIRYDTDFTGTVNLTLEDGSCSGEVSDSIQPNTKDIDITGVYNDFTYTISYELDTTTNPPVLN